MHFCGILVTNDNERKLNEKKKILKMQSVKYALKLLERLNAQGFFN